MAESFHFVSESEKVLIIYSKVALSDVRDIHDVLEITVYDEDKEHKYEFLGKVNTLVFFLLNQIYICLDHDTSNEDQKWRKEMDQAER